MKTDMTSDFASNASATARLLGFLFLLGLFVPAYGVARMIGKEAEAGVPLFLYKCVLKVIGFRVRARGRVSRRQPTLFVSNHASYLDVPVLGSLIKGHFVAKSEVASWPIIGPLARMHGTLFVERRTVRAATQKDVLRQALEKGESVIFFPEGTSSDGRAVLPFKSSLFSVAEGVLGDDNKPVRVQPVSIVCTQIGGLPAGRLWRPYYAWYGDMTFVRHFWNALKIGSFTVEVVFHAPTDMTAFASRKDMARHCHALIADGVNECVAGRRCA